MEDCAPYDSLLISICPKSIVCMIYWMILVCSLFQKQGFIQSKVCGITCVSFFSIFTIGNHIRVFQFAYARNENLP